MGRRLGVSLAGAQPGVSERLFASEGLQSQLRLFCSRVSQVSCVHASCPLVANRSALASRTWMRGIASDAARARSVPQNSRPCANAPWRSGMH